MFRARSRSSCDELSEDGRHLGFDATNIRHGEILDQAKVGEENVEKPKIRLRREENRGNFDAGVQRKRVNADGKPRMLPALAEHRDHEVRCAVDDGRLIGECRNARNETLKAHP